MPLITIKTNPDAWLVEPERRGRVEHLRRTMEQDLGPALPSLFMQHKEALGLDDTTTVKAVQVEHGTFGHYDVNVPDLGIFIQFTEVIENAHALDRIRSRLVDILVTWFDGAGFAMPTCALDIKWGPMRGAFWVDGQFKGDY